MDCALLLDQIISDIEKENFKCEFVNSGLGSYHYSEEITDLFKILESAKYRAIFDDNIESYSYADKKETRSKYRSRTIYFNRLCYSA